MTENKLQTELPPFAMIPRWIIQHKQLTSGAVRVYACLADMAGRDRPAWPSHRTLAIKTNMSVSSVRRHIRELKTAGALRVQQRYHPDGNGQQSNIYTIVSTNGDKTTTPTKKNNPVTTDEQPPYAPTNDRVITREQEPVLNTLEQIKKAREVLQK